MQHFSADQREAFDELPDVLTVYRGCSRARASGVSWTLDEEVAQRFTKGHRAIPVPDPVVVVGRITKAEIFGVFIDRNESEIVLDPKRLR